jgi:tRNA threonylcarbamoyladenosine biosynthesis protein TsaE
VTDAATGVRSATEIDTLAFGERLGARLEAGDLLLLSGQLGAGKTVLVRGIAAGMGIDPAAVRSPTFVLHHVYRAGARVLHHIDLYRLGPHADVRLLDIDDMLESGGVVVVEWGEYADVLAGTQVRIVIDIEDDGARLLTPSRAPERMEAAWGGGAAR